MAVKLGANAKGMVSVNDTPYQKGTLQPFPYNNYATMGIAFKDASSGDMGLVDSIPYSQYSDAAGVPFASASDLRTFVEENFFFSESGGGGIVYPGVGLDYRLRDASGILSENWNARTLNDTTGITSINFASRQLIRASGVKSMDWGVGALYDAADVRSVDFTSRELLRIDGGRSINWSNNRNAIRDDQNYVSIIWGGSTYYDPIPGKYANTRLLVDGLSYSGRGAVSIAYQDRRLFDENEEPAMSWSVSSRTLQQFNGNATLNWNSLILADSYGVNAAEWGARTLKDDTSASSINWGSRQLQSGGVSVLNWNFGELGTQSGQVAMDWFNRELVTETNISTVKWDVDDTNGGRIMSIRGSNTAAFGLDYGFTEGAGGGVTFGDYTASGELYILLQSGATGGTPRVVRIPYANM